MDAHPVVSKLNGIHLDKSWFPFLGFLRMVRVRLWNLRINYPKDKREIQVCDLRFGLGKGAAGARGILVGASGSGAKLSSLTCVHLTHPSGPESSPFPFTHLSWTDPVYTPAIHPSLSS